MQAASPHESQLVEEAIGHSFLDELPARLIGDKAYDSDGLDRQMEKQYGIEMIAPHRGNRLDPTQDGRALTALSETLDHRASVRLAANLSPPGHALGIPRREFLRHGPARLHETIA